MPRPNNRDTGSRENLDCAAHEKHDGRIIDLLEQRRICWIVKPDNSSACRGRTHQLLFRRAQRSTVEDCLRGCSVQSRRLKLGERSMEGALQRNEVLE